MPTPNRPLAQNKYSNQDIINMSFDEDFNVQTFELLGYDPLSGTSGALKRVTINALGDYAVNDIDDINVVNVTFLGKEDAAGDWYIQKIDETSGKSFRYATKNNNATYTNYTDAWNDHQTLTYDTYSTAF